MSVAAFFSGGEFYEKMLNNKMVRSTFAYMPLVNRPQYVFELNGINGFCFSKITHASLLIHFVAELIFIFIPPEANTEKRMYKNKSWAPVFLLHFLFLMLNIL